MSNAIQAAAAAFISGKNLLINGNFDIWQRGISFSNSNSTPTAYTADRWQVYRSGWATGVTANQGAGINGVPGAYTGINIIRSSGDTSTANINLSYPFETMDVRKMAGQQLTLSFWAVAYGAFVGAPLTLSVASGTGSDGSPPAGFTNAVVTNTGVGSMMGAWKKFTATFTVPSGSSQFGFTILTAPTGTAAANNADNFYIAQVQLEFGPIATAFERRTYGQELALCQRYYETGVQPFSFIAGLSGVNAAYGTVPFLVQKRVNPTMTLTGWKYYSGGADTVFTPANVNGMTGSFTWQGLNLTNWTGWDGAGSWIANAEL